MFWLVHIDASSNGWNFDISLDFKSRHVKQDHHSFGIMQWFGRSTQFIEKWKRSNAYVFFDFNGRIFFLANKRLSEKINNGIPLLKGEYALCLLTREEFIDAVKRSNS